MNCKKIFDTSSIIMLIDEVNKANVFEILVYLGYQLELPISVYGEIKHQFDDIRKIVDNGHVTILDEMRATHFLRLKNRYPQLGNGEIEVLAHGLYYDETGNTEYYCILDDKLPRKVAKKHGIQFTGTLGLLNHMCKRDCFSDDEINDLNDKLNNCRVPKEHRLPF